MPCCAAPRCRNRHENGVRLFRWPRAADRTLLWAVNCGLGPKWRPSASARLCEVHFDASEFEQRRQDGWRKLKQNAVPTIFDDFEKIINSATKTKKLRQNESTTDDSRSIDVHTLSGEQRDEPNDERNVSGRVVGSGCSDVLASDVVWNSSEICARLAKLAVNCSPDVSCQRLRILNQLLRQWTEEQSTQDVQSHNSTILDQSDKNHDSHEVPRSDESDVNHGIRDVTASNPKMPEESRRHDHCNKDHAYCRTLCQNTSLYECPFCCHLCTSTSALKLHLVSHLQNEPTTERLHKCPLCGKQFLHRKVLLSHIGIVHTELKSSNANSNESTTSGLDVSQTSQTSRPPAATSPNGGRSMCAVCGRLFADRNGLRRHERVHSGERPYLCPVCGRRFAACSTLHKHSAVHSGIRPLVCAFCGRSFAQAGDLRKHVRIHTGDKPYVCSVCGCRFTRKYLLGAHLRRHSSGPLTYACDTCGIRFRLERRLRMHEQYAHARVASDS